MGKNNKEIAESLEKFSDLLEASGDNPYRVRAYRRAARSILKLDTDIELLLAQGFDLTTLPWIGDKIADTINHLLSSNEELVLKNDSNKVLNELQDIHGLGPQKIKLLNQKYNIYTKRSLLRALEADTISEFNEHLKSELKKETRKPRKKNKFLRLFYAITVVDSLLRHLRELPGVQWVECAGEFRRKKDVINEIDFIICTQNFTSLINHITSLSAVKDLVQQSDECISVNLRVGVKMNLYSLPKASLGNALLFYTGNKAHVEHLIQIAANKGYLLQKNGLFAGQKTFENVTEKDIYHALDLAYIEPELREDKGEITAALNHALPQLIQLEDIIGDLHSHTNETDGSEPLENMVHAAIRKGYHYLAITDHSKRLAITHGLDEKRLLQQIAQIDKLNEQLTDFIVLKSIEVDILEDGSLDLSNDVLKELDIVLCSIHSKFNLPESQQTERIIRAMDNPYFDILGHATGRLIKSRPPYPITIEKILWAAKERGCFIELNAQPYRMDINDDYCQLAKKIGVKVAISTDAHSIRNFNFMPVGIYQARRGWLEKSDVINTYEWPCLKKMLRKR